MFSSGDERGQGFLESTFEELHIEAREGGDGIRVELAACRGEQLVKAIEIAARVNINPRTQRLDLEILRRERDGTEVLRKQAKAHAVLMRAGHLADRRPMRDSAGVKNVSPSGTGGPTITA